MASAAGQAERFYLEKLRLRKRQFVELIPLRRRPVGHCRGVQRPQSGAEAGSGYSRPRVGEGWCHAGIQHTASPKARRDD